MIKNLLVLLVALGLTTGCDKKAETTAASATASTPTVAQEAPPVKPDTATAAAEVPFQGAAPADAKKTASGLAYKTLKAGSGKVNPKAADSVTVHYTGWTTDGKSFDSSVKRGKPATFPLRNVIKGWTEGLQLMVEGEKTRFWIPANLAYGEKPAGGRPGGLLVFDVELLTIGSAPVSDGKPVDPVALVKSLNTKMCACKDLNCLKGLQNDTQAVAMAMATATDEQKAEVTKLQEEAKACVQKIIATSELQSAPVSDGKPVDPVALAKSLNTKMCACKDMNCLKGLQNDARAMAMAMGTATDEQKAEVTKLQEGAKTCVQKIIATSGLAGAAGAPPMKPGSMPKTPLIKKATALKDKICACQDQKCVATVSQEANTLQADFMKATDEEKLAMRGLGMEMGKCIQKLMPKPTFKGAPPGLKGAAPAAKPAAAKPAAAAAKPALKK
jgi:FKBP-type peptidyl-prolyl cis-trans isomerase